MISRATDCFFLLFLVLLIHEIGHILVGKLSLKTLLVFISTSCVIGGDAGRPRFHQPLPRKGCKKFWLGLESFTLGMNFLISSLTVFSVFGDI